MRLLLGEVTDRRLRGFGCSPLIVDGLNILFSGYICNASEFVAKSGEARDAGDPAYFASAVAAAYRRFGESLSEHVYGQYTVVVHDPTNHRSLLSHDLLGVEPLYYRERHGVIRFSNDLAQLVDDGAIDEEYVADYLCYGDHYGDRTPYVSIRRLPAANALTIAGGKFQIISCWKGIQPKTMAPHDFAQCAETLRDLLGEAVRTAFPRSGTAWCELSGGLDSSTVVGLAACSASRKPETLSYVYSSSPRADETPYVDMVCERWKLSNHKVDVDLSRSFSTLPARRYAQPNPAMINGAFHAAIADVLDADVVLTGMGGDAVLFGDGPEPFYLADLLRTGQLGALQHGIAVWKNTDERRPLRYWLTRCVTEPAWHYARRHVIQDQLPHISWLQGSPGSATRNGRPRRTWVPPTASVHQSWFFERVLRSANVVAGWEFLEDLGRAEFRHPLLYVPLVRFMASVPPEFAFSPELDRRLHRAAAAGFLPEIIQRRRTKGSPDQSLYRGFARSEAWRTLLTVGPHIVARGYVDGPAWMAAVRLAGEGRCESIKHFRAAATLEAWLRQPARNRPSAA